MSVRVEAIVIEALRDWLRLQLPAKVDEVNLDRAAVVKTPVAGPFTIPSGAVAKVSFAAVDIDDNPSDFTSYPLTAGSRTAAQVAADLNTAHITGAAVTIGWDGNPDHDKLTDTSHLPAVVGSFVLHDANGIVPAANYTVDETLGTFDFTGHTVPTGTVTADYAYTGTTIATVDSAGRVVITDPTPPTAAGHISIVVIAPDTTGANIAMGWDAGGEKERRSPIIGPTRSAVLDGWPQGPVAQLGQGFTVVVGDRSSKPWGEILRRNEYAVSLELVLFHFVDAAEAGLSREHIQSVLRCVREVLFTDNGRYLGRAGQGDTMLCLEVDSKVSERPFKWLDAGAPNVLFDVAFIHLSVRIFEVPAQS